MNTLIFLFKCIFLICIGFNCFNLCKLYRNYLIIKYDSKKILEKNINSKLRICGMNWLFGETIIRCNYKEFKKYINEKIHVVKTDDIGTYFINIFESTLIYNKFICIKNVIYIPKNFISYIFIICKILDYDSKYLYIDNHYNFIENRTNKICKILDIIYNDNKFKNIVNDMIYHQYLIPGKYNNFLDNKFITRDETKIIHFHNIQPTILTRLIVLSIYEKIDNGDFSYINDGKLNIDNKDKIIDDIINSVLLYINDRSKNNNCNFAIISECNVVNNINDIINSIITFDSIDDNIKHILKNWKYHYYSKNEWKSIPSLISVESIKNFEDM